MNMSPRGLFITGTDTGVGKTIFTSALLRTLIADGVNVAGYKPACSGAEFSPLVNSRAFMTSGSEVTLPAPEPVTQPHWGDVEFLYSATRGRWPRERICPQRFFAPLSPPAAAFREGRTVDEALLVDGYRWLADQAEMVVVEGAGGFYSPISSNWLNADLAEKLALPVVVVSPNRLGTINQTLLTIEAIRGRGLSVAGVVLNCLAPRLDESVMSNHDEIERRGNVSVWGQLPYVSATELQPERLPETISDVMKATITGPG
jgi:dethiobiotin synthetase